MPEDATQQPLLTGTSDPYNGITIDVACLPQAPEAFTAAITASMAEWRAQGRRAVWLELPAQLASHVPIAVSAGFEYHHVQGTSLVLSAWLQNEPDKRPGYATHFVGVGGAVVNDKGELLLVRERYAYSWLWKLPGGLAAPGEDIGTAAVREVREETGLETEFEGIIGVRQLPVARMGAGDVYFVCKLRALDQDAPLRREESEIAEIRWIDLDEYRQMKLPALMRTIADALAQPAPVAKPVVPQSLDGRVQHIFINPSCPAHKSKL
eukprot:m51a1_g13852 hypothetical protein (266) ;mRNA; r:573920-575002